MKKLLKWILYIFIGLVIIGYFAGNNDKGSNSSYSSDTEAAAPQKEIYNTTARQLFTYRMSMKKTKSLPMNS